MDMPCRQSARALPRASFDVGKPATGDTTYPFTGWQELSDESFRYAGRRSSLFRRTLKRRHCRGVASRAVSPEVPPGNEGQGRKAVLKIEKIRASGASSDRADQGR